MDVSYKPQELDTGLMHARNAVSSNEVKIVGDIGGTNARFACVTDEGNYYHNLSIYKCKDYSTLSDALQLYISDDKVQEGLSGRKIGAICLAIAGPVIGDIVDLPNNHWTFSRTRLQRLLGVHVDVINDFTAQTLSLDLLADDELEWFDEHRPTGLGRRVVIGPGTGLGVSIQMQNGEVIPSEAGHIGFSPKNDHQIEILKILWDLHKRISIERLLSGQGLENLYWANSLIFGDEKKISAPEVYQLATTDDPVAKQTLNDFFDMLACFAGDMALAAWATDGVYLSGGILPKVWKQFDKERFRSLFHSKGRFSDFCKKVPLSLIRAEQPGLLGCVAAVSQKQ